MHPPPGRFTRFDRGADRTDSERLRRLTVQAFIVYATALVLVAVTALGALELASYARTYVEGESLWSKAQKEAVIALDAYAANGTRAEWRQYRAALEAPRGFRRAREELMAEEPDLERARRAMLEGGFDGEEISGAIRLFRWFGGWSPVERALAIWARGDSLIGRLDRQASRVRSGWRSSPPDTAAIRRAMARTGELNEELGRAERAFTAAIDEAADTAHRWAHWLIVLLTLLLVAGGGGLAWLAYRTLRAREDALRQAEARYRRIFEDSRDGVFVSDRKGEIVELNAAGLEMLGYTRDELSELRAEDLYHDPGQMERYRRRMEENGHVQGHELQLETRDGEVLDCEVTASTRVRDGEVVGYQGIVRDVTDRKEFEAELQRQALHDALTGLPNRTLLWDRLEHAVARFRREEGHLAVLFLDLDRFKVVNDSLSHAAGDQVLVQVGERMRSCLRDPDTVARVGGDEFVVLLEGVGAAEEAEAVARRISAAFEPPFMADGEEVHLDLSCGLTWLDPSADADGSDARLADELVRRADQAMYRAKSRPGTSTQVYEAEGMSRVPRVQEENELRRALEREELVLHYQPIMDLDEERVAAVEPLVRWQHPEKGLLGPGEFLSLAEATGLIVDLGAWVLETAAREAAAWEEDPASGPPLHLHVNLSATQFSDPEMTDRLEAVLRESGFPSHRLELEVTEHSIMQAPGRTRALADMGVGVCIDDFGTGYSSLSYVKELSADCLKVDMSFVHGIGSDPADEAIISTILTLGRSLSLDVVAEGVETEEQRRWLEEKGCRWAQGYLFARPAPAEAFTRWLDESRNAERSRRAGTPDQPVR